MPVAKFKSYRKSIPVPIYGGRFTVIMATELTSLIPEFNLERDHASEVDAMTFTIDGNIYCAFEMGIIKPGNVAHEAKHAVNRMFNYVGVTLDTYNDEAECYFLGWVVERIHETWEAAKKAKRQANRKPIKKAQNESS